MHEDFSQVDNLARLSRGYGINEVEQTLGFIKPHVEMLYVRALQQLLKDQGFTIITAHWKLFDKDTARELYASLVFDMKDFEGMITYLSSGRILYMELEKENAINDLRDLLPSIRCKYGADGYKNIMHALDSKENYIKEKEIYGNVYMRYF